MIAEAGGCVYYPLFGPARRLRGMRRGVYVFFATICGSFWGLFEGLSADEVAFCDAVAHNQSAVEVMGNDSLKVIAHELTSLKSTITVVWRTVTARGRAWGSW